MQTAIFCFLVALTFFSIGAALFLTVAIVGSLLRLLIALMPYAVAIGLSFLLWGCDSITLEEEITQTTFAEIGARESLLDGWKVELMGSPKDSCGGRGCYILDWKTIRVYRGSDATVAELLCHEIVHLHLLDTTGDMTHQRQDLFGVACGRVASVFVDSTAN